MIGISSSDDIDDIALREARRKREGPCLNSVAFRCHTSFADGSQPELAEQCPRRGDDPIGGRAFRRAFERLIDERTRWQFESPCRIRERRYALGDFREDSIL